MSAADLQKRIAELEAERSLEVEQHQIRMSNLELRIMQLQGAATMVLKNELDLRPGALVQNVVSNTIVRVVKSNDVPAQLVATTHLWENICNLQQVVSERDKKFFDVVDFAVSGMHKYDAQIKIEGAFSRGFLELCTYHGWNKQLATDVKRILSNHFVIQEMVYQRWNASWRIVVEI